MGGTSDFLLRYGLPLTVSVGLSMAGSWLTRSNVDHDALTTLQANHAALQSLVEKNDKDITHQLDGIVADLKVLTQSIPGRR